MFSKWKLLSAFADRKKITLPDPKNLQGRGASTGIVNKIQHEDGSGNSFLVTILEETSKKEITLYVRTQG